MALKKVIEEVYSGKNDVAHSLYKIFKQYADKVNKIPEHEETDTMNEGCRYSTSGWDLRIPSIPCGKISIRQTIHTPGGKITECSIEFRYLEGTYIGDVEEVREHIRKSGLKSVLK